MARLISPSRSTASPFASSPAATAAWAAGGVLMAAGHMDSTTCRAVMRIWIARYAELS
jgi:hypothetical protein